MDEDAGAVANVGTHVDVDNRCHSHMYMAYISIGMSMSMIPSMYSVCHAVRVHSIRHVVNII